MILSKNTLWKKLKTAVNIEFGNGRLRIMTSHDLDKKLDIIADLHIKQLYEKMLASFKLNQVQVWSLSLKKTQQKRPPIT